MNKIINIPDNSLIILVGIAGAGKSTFAKETFGNDERAVIISSDDIRKRLCGDSKDQTANEQVFEIFYREIEEKLKEGKTTIADATNLQERARRELYDIAKRCNVPIYALVLNVPLDRIKRQNTRRDRVVPEYAIDRMYKQFGEAYHAIAQELPKGHVIDIISPPRRITKDEHGGRDR